MWNATGHHYVNGFSGQGAGREEQHRFLASQPGLYETVTGSVRLAIRDGVIDIASLDAPGFAAGGRTGLDDARARWLRPRKDRRARGCRMALPIEDYALIGDCHTAALVGRDGSIDWLCLPRFDSGACFAALLGEPRHGRWLISPKAQPRSIRRQYRDGTLILETEVETDDGAVRIIDCMPLSNERWDVLRIVAGLTGRVAMRMELVIRFDYGSIVPWVRQVGDALLATAGPDTLELRTPVAVRGET
jgi:hypothetical protein